MTDFTLYLVTDRRLSGGRATADIVREAVDGGVSCVQLREKRCDTREFIEEARRLRQLLRGTGIPLIINDRVDVALAAGADGIHLGQRDMAIADARQLAGRSMLIGISAESLDDALRAEAEGADYIGASPVFATATKDDAAPPLGLDGLSAMRAAVRLPIVAIGGIHHGNVDGVIRAGAAGVAVVSAIVAAPCPRSAAAQLLATIRQTRGSMP